MAPPTQTIYRTSVAIVESHRALREGFTAHLSNEPDIAVVATASSFSEVRAVTSTRHLDVLVLDLDLDGAGNVELMKDAQSVQPRPAVVVLTANQHSQATRTALRMGVSVCVFKQAPISDLVTAVRWAGRGEAWLLSQSFSGIVAKVNASSGSSEDEIGIESLSPRELEILTLLVEGYNHKCIAAKLNIAVNTVRTHTRNLQSKLNVHSNLSAVAMARNAGVQP